MKPKLDLKVDTGVDPIILEMHSQNDRGAAIAGAVFLEEKLKEAIIKRWPPISNTVRDKLFTGYAPLATFSAKIAIAYAMGVLNVHSKSDCEKIRLLRNNAAHIGTPFLFSMPENRKHLSELRCTDAMPLDEQSDDTYRNLFTTTIKVLTAYLMFQEHWKHKFGFNAVMPDFLGTSGKTA